MRGYTLHALGNVVEQIGKMPNVRHTRRMLAKLARLAARRIARREKYGAFLASMAKG